MNERIREQALGLCKLLYDKKAQEILAVPVMEKTVVADWFVIASGRAVSQVKALCDELEEKAGELGLTLRRQEGYSTGRWIVLDFSDILVHLFYPEERQYYNIERLWDEAGSAVNYSLLMDEREREAEKAAHEKEQA